MSKFSNGIDDLFTDDSGGFSGRAVMLIATAVFWLLSALTTFGFFATYAPSLGEWLYPAAGWAVAGLQGIILLDTATFVWSYLSRQNGSTMQQITIARAASWGTLAGALLVSFLFVLFSVSFDLGIYTADGGMTTFGLVMSWMGGVVMTLAFVGNFAAAALFVAYSEQAQRAMQAAQLSSVARAGQHAADRARAEHTIRHTLHDIEAQLPSLARQAGKANADHYKDAHFGDMNGDGVVDSRDQELWERQVARELESGITPGDVVGRAFHQGYNELYRLAARLLLGGATQNDAYREIKQHPDAFREIDTTLLSIADDAAGIIDQLRKERESDQRIARALQEEMPTRPTEPLPTPNGNGNQPRRLYITQRSMGLKLRKRQDAGTTATEPIGPSSGGWPE